MRSGEFCMGLEGVIKMSDEKPLSPVVEVEEEVYSFTDPNNGAGPMWAHGNTCMVRIGRDVYATGIETIPDAKPLNNIRWVFYRREEQGWQVQAKGTGRTREPCPLVCFQDGSLFLSDNPTLTLPDQYNGPSRPEVIRFSVSQAGMESQVLVPRWLENPSFTEHSYRSFVADSENGELILFQNIGYTHAEWTFRDRQGEWSTCGRLQWPWGADYPTPQPIRICYPTVALKNRAVYFCGVSDIVEPYPEWRQFKKEITGKEWDYDFRRLFFTWSEDITAGRFSDWVEISSRDKTGGWITPCDLWVGPDETVRLLWIEKAIDPRLREKYFPGEKQSFALNFAVVKNGKVILKRALESYEEGPGERELYWARFQVTPLGRLFVFYSVGKPVLENRVMEIFPDGRSGPSVPVKLKRPFPHIFYTASWRAGCRPSDLLDLYGPCEEKPNTLYYARVRLV